MHSKIYSRLGCDIFSGIGLASNKQAASINYNTTVIGLASNKQAASINYNTTVYIYSYVITHHIRDVGVGSGADRGCGITL